MSPRQKSSPASGKAPRSTSHPTHEEIEFRGYQMYLERGGEHGRDVEDWLQAQLELLKKYKKSRASATSGKVR
jgi:hypothetical protein